MQMTESDVTAMELQKQKVLRLAMEWFAEWNKQFGPPSAFNGQDTGEVPLWRACRKLDRMRGKRR